MENELKAPITGKEIPISDDMPEDLKQALAYLNERGIGLNDNIEVMSDEELNGDSSLFPDTEEDLDESFKEAGERLEHIREEEINTSDLDEMF